MNNNHHIERIRAFSFKKPTNDNWYPCFEGQLVECNGFVIKNSFKGIAKYWSKVTVQGNDDFGLEKEFYGSRMECILFYKHWFHFLNKMSIIDQKDILSLGFRRM